MTQGQPFKVLDYLKFEDESKRWGVINEGEKVKDKLGALKKDLNNKVESKARELEEQELRIKEERQNVERERQQVEREKQGNEDILNRLGKENADQKKVIEDLQRRLAANNAILEKILPPAAARPADLGNTNKNTQVKPSVTISSSPEVTNANLVSSKNKEGGSPRSAPGKLSADRFKSFQQELKK